MKRKVVTTPTRIYTYGCLPPIHGGEQLEDQLRRAHRYRNGLVEIERRRRESIAVVQREHDALGPLLERIHSIETLIGELRKDAKMTHSGGGDRDWRLTIREAIEAAQADLSVLRLIRAAAKYVARGDSALKTAYDAVNAAAYDECKTLRNSDVAPYWGTYLIVDKAAEAWRKATDAPRFMRYDGSGRVAVQLQGGLTTAELTGGEDTRLRIGPGNIRKTKRHPNGAPVRPEHRTISIRVGSDGRTPVWATLPMTLHRELPADGLIKWAWIIRRREGVRYRYELQLTIEATSFVPSAHRSQETVALDIGSRDLPTGAVRVAYWVDSAGRRGEITSPRTRLSSPTGHGRGRRHAVIDGPDKIQDLQSIRSKHLDEIKIALGGYRRVAVGCEWYQERTTHMHAWRSPARIGILYRDWQRHAGDDEIYAVVGAYLKQDRHLLDWQTNETKRGLARRRNRYRVLATQMARDYSTIVIAKRDYRREKRPAEEAPSTQGHSGRTIMRSVAPGELCETLRQAAAKYGAKLIEIAIEGDTAWAVDPKVCERMIANTKEMNTEAVSLARTTPQSTRNNTKLPRGRRLGTNAPVDPLANQDITSRNMR